MPIQARIFSFKQVEYFRCYELVIASLIKADILRRHHWFGVTALQVVRTSFLGPRPCRFPPPPLTTSFSENVVVAETSLYLSNRKRFASLHSLI